MNQLLSSQIIDMLVEKISEDEDANLLQAMGVEVNHQTDFIGSVRLSNNRKILFEQVCHDKTYLFTLKDRRRRRIIEKEYFSTLFDGIEHFMSEFNEDDSNALWRWYLKHEEERTVVDFSRF